MRNGEPKPVYLDRGEAHAKAREFLRSAKTAGDIAGRQVVLLAMARYTDEAAIAQSQRSFYTLSPGSQLPFSGEVIDLLDDLAHEKLPSHVLDRGREERERQAAERAKDREDAAWYEQELARLEAMSPDERQALLVEASERFDGYDGGRLRQRIEQLAADEPADESAGGEAA